jgi:2-amino-4-hydroxy-6-hydroxymethyldihydropteridine diphosphokinase
MTSVVIALGSNLGDREDHLRRALHELHRVMRIVRVSRILETEPVGAPAGSGRFLNMVIAGYTTLTPEALMAALLAIEERLGRRRTTIRNAPRTIDLDLIAAGGERRRSRGLTLPHPRAREREFVMTPLQELGLAFVLA